MHKFIDIPVQLQHSTGMKYWKVMVSFGYQSDVLKETLWIPAGFKTDFASIPKPVRWLIDNDDPIILEAAIVHDYLYHYSKFYPRSMADQVLIEAMEDLNAPAYKRWLVYCAVRMFGKPFQKK